MINDMVTDKKGCLNIPNDKTELTLRVKHNHWRLWASYLAEHRKRAIRGRVWFKSLDGLERGILSLSVKVLDVAVVHSCLGKVLTSIVAKIEDALKSVFERRLGGYGRRGAGEM